MAIIMAAVIATAIAVFFDRRIEEAIASGVMIITMIMYLCGRWYSFIPGYICVGVIIVGALIFIVFGLVTDRGAVCRTVFTCGSLAFGIYILFFAYYAFHRDFSHPDELYCWGLMAREFYDYHVMFSPFATSLSGDTTPFLPIWNAVSARAWFGFSDTVCYFAQNMFTISLMIPIFAHIRKKLRPAEFIVITVMLPLILVVSGMEGFQYILADIVLAAELCFYFMNVIAWSRTDDMRQKWFYYMSVMLVLVSMCLTKRVGVVFASLALVSTISLFWHGTERYIKELTGLTVATVIASFTWFGVDKIILIPIAAVSGTLVLRILLLRIELFSGVRRVVALIGIFGICAAGAGAFVFGILGRTGYGYAVLARFMEDLFAIKLSSPDGYGCIILSYGLFILLAITTSVYMRLHGGDTRITGVLSWLPLSMLLYAAVMLYTHIYDTGPMNRNMESLIPRYIIPWEILVVFVVIYAFLIDSAQMDFLCLLIVLMLLILISDTGTLLRGMFSKHRCIGYYALSNAGITLESGDLVYFVDEQPVFFYSDREFYYCCAPARTNFIDQIFYGNNGRIEMTADELAQDIADDRYLHESYDYLYLQSYDDDFSDRYGDLFENKADIAPGTAYRVDTTGGRLSLSTINNANE